MDALSNNDVIYYPSFRKNEKKIRILNTERRTYMFTGHNSGRGNRYPWIIFSSNSFPPTLVSQTRVTMKNKHHKAIDIWYFAQHMLINWIVIQNNEEIYAVKIYNLMIHTLNSSNYWHTVRKARCQGRTPPNTEPQTTRHHWHWYICGQQCSPGPSIWWEPVWDYACMVMCITS